MTASCALLVLAGLAGDALAVWGTRELMPPGGGIDAYGYLADYEAIHCRAIDGIFDDTDPDGPEGETDLTAIDTWERGTTFTASGFRADFQYGCSQHQATPDSDSFSSIDGPTRTTALNDSIISAFDSFHDHGTSGGSEIVIPWNVLCGLGPGTVPPYAELSLASSICWDPEPEGELGEDSAPSNISAALLEIDTVYMLTIDGDGLPDEGGTDVPHHEEFVSARSSLLQNSPNPFNATTAISFFVGNDTAQSVLLEVYDPAGRRVATLVDERMAPGEHTVVWNGVDRKGRQLATGVYLARLSVGDETDVIRMTMLK